MVKKTKKKLVIFYVLTAIIIIIGGIFAYNFLKKGVIEKGWFPEKNKVGEEQVSPPEEEGETETPYIPRADGLADGLAGGGSGGGSSGGEAPVEYTTDLTICTNAQNSGLCNGLDIAYGEGYKVACCSERGLCC